MSDSFKFRVWDNAENKYNGFSFHLAMSGELDRLSVDGDLLEADKNRFTIEQCTGIKDCHGKLIYEGDLIRLVQYGEIKHQGVVEWFSAGGTFCGGWITVDYSPNDKRNTASYIFSNEWEVYGNIHETEIEMSKWKPKFNEWFYYIDTAGFTIKSWTFDAYSEDAFYKNGNCFKTEEEAQRALEKTKELLLELHSNSNRSEEIKQCKS